MEASSTLENIRPPVVSRWSRKVKNNCMRFQCQNILLYLLLTYPLQGWGQVQLTKYSSTPSTPNIYQVQVLVKYSFLKKYLSTSSTSTHIKICSKVRMDIQSRVNFGWKK